MVNPSNNLRAIAARAVAGVLRGRSLDDALPASADGFTRALAYGVLRHQRLLAALAARLLTGKAHEDIEALLLCGLYQLRSMEVAAHAAVNETVEATSALNQPRARGLVNAVLRRYQREREELERSLPDETAVQHSHPDWLLTALRRDWPQHWESLLRANNEQAPLTLRVNARRVAFADYHKQVEAQTLPACRDALVLRQAVPVEEIPGFAAGHCSVQDASAQLAVDLLAVQDGQRVLDACAAPGGKTAHLLERASLDVLALDANAIRQQRVQQNLTRLGLSARLVTADAGEPETWWDGKAFDRILLDAPCSGTGVIRRHPDIKWLRRERDIPSLAAQQLRLLRALWPTLAPGGLLLYAVCSVLSAEGDEVLRAFLGSERDASAQAIAADWGEASEFGRRIAPGGAFDGFFYALLRKPA